MPYKCKVKAYYILSVSDSYLLKNKTLKIKDHKYFLTKAKKKKHGKPGHVFKAYLYDYALIAVFKT